MNQFIVLISLDCFQIQLLDLSIHSYVADGFVSFENFISICCLFIHIFSIECLCSSDSIFAVNYEQTSTVVFPDTPHTHSMSFDFRKWKLLMVSCDAPAICGTVKTDSIREFELNVETVVAYGPRDTNTNTPSALRKICCSFSFQSHANRESRF